jgi:hypothetical protein
VSIFIAFRPRLWTNSGKMLSGPGCIFFLVLRIASFSSSSKKFVLKIYLKLLYVGILVCLLKYFSCFLRLFASLWALVKWPLKQFAIRMFPLLFITN